MVGGYYDAGDNVKFNFPMAFSTTILAWSVLEFGNFMGSDLSNALDAIKWATGYFLKATSIPGFVYAQVGDPYADHNCWERPEDMDTPRTSYAVSKQFPGSEVSAEIAAALAASSLVFRAIDLEYSARLLSRARTVNETHFLLFRKLYIYIYVIYFLLLKYIYFCSFLLLLLLFFPACFMCLSSLAKY